MRLRTCLTLVCLSLSSVASADRIVSPDKDTPEYALLDAVRLIADGHFESFIARYCHPGLLCVEPQAVARVQRDLLPAVQARYMNCLIGEGRHLEVAGISGDVTDPDAQLVVALDCGGEGYTLQVHRFRARWWIASF